MLQSDDSLTNPSPPVNTFLTPGDTKLITLFNEFRNDSRIIYPITHPSHKLKDQQLQRIFYAPGNYRIVMGTLREALDKHLHGYHWCFGEFEYDAQARRKYKSRSSGAYTEHRRGQLAELKKQAERIRAKDRLVTQQVFVIEIDKGLTESSIDEFLESRPFVRQNAYAVVESVRSRYDDPNDDTCNGELRVRIFYVLPKPIRRDDFPEYFEGILKHFNSCLQAINDHVGCDTSGSDPVGGALGIKDATHIIINQFVDKGILAEWEAEWNKEIKQRPTRHNPIDHAAPANLPEEYRDAVSQLTFKSDGWSTTYLPCPWENHTYDGWGSPQNKTGVLQHEDGNGYTLHCFKCNQKQSYRSTPRATTAFSHLSSSYLTPEHKELSRHVLGIDSAYGWQPGYPWASRNGQPPEAEKRRLYNELCRGKCDSCGGKTLAWMDSHRLSAGYHCESCHRDAEKGSWLKLQLERKPANSVTFDLDGYLAHNLLDTPPHAPGKITFIAAAMGTGKTQAVIRRAYNDKEEGFEGVTLILTPRKTLAKGLWLAEQREGHGGDLAWGLFCGGSTKDQQTIGKYGAIGTIASFHKMLKKTHDDTEVRIIIDEFDFTAGGKGLLNATILKRLSKHAKAKLTEVTKKHGLVLLGQTATLADVEAFNAELGLNPETDIKAFYKPAPKSDSIAEILHYLPVEGKTNNLVAGVRNTVKTDLDAGKRVYVFADGRRTAQLIAELDSNALILDKYRRGDPRNRDLLYREQQDDTQLFVSSNAVDVGISIRDQAAVHIVLSENPLNFGSVFSTVQKCMRNREKPNITIHCVPHNNPLPTTPSWNTHRMQKALNNQNATVDLIAIAESLHEFAADQPNTVFEHHLEYAGYDIKHTKAPAIHDDDVVRVAALKKYLIDQERDESKRLALESLKQRNVSTTDEIELSIDKGEFNSPAEAIAAEKVNQACRASGWQNEVIDITNDQWESAHRFIENKIDFDRHCNRRESFIRLHLPHCAWERRQAEIDNDQLEFSKISPHPGAKEELLAKLLKALPQNWSDRDTMEAAILRVFQDEYKNRPLSEYAKDGSMGRGIAKTLRFANLGKDIKPGQNDKVDLIKWANLFLETNYFARIAKRGSRYSLVRTTKSQIELDVINVWLKHRYPDINSVDENIRPDLIPSPISAPDAELIESARKMAKEGLSVDQIGDELGRKEKWVWANTKDVRNNRKAELKNKTYQLKVEGKTYHEIASALKIPLGTIKTWLKDAQERG